MSAPDLAAARQLPQGNPDLTAPTLPALIASRLRDRRHEPYLTFYDDATGERTELSYATFDNWVSKTANLLVEELGLQRGDRVATLLGHHWSAVVVAFACWKAGCCLVAADAHPPALGWDGVRAAFVREGRLGAVRESAHPVPDGLVVVGAGIGARLSAGAEDPGDALSYAEEVLAFGDDYDDPAVHAGDDALLVPAGGAGPAVRLTQGNLLAAAEALRAWGLRGEDRLVCARAVHEPDALVLGHLAPFLAGAAVVLTSGPEGAWRKTAAERGTLALVSPGELDRLAGVPPDGLRAVLLTAGAPTAMVAGARERLGVPVVAGHGLAEATYAAALEPLDLDAATRAWLDAAGGRSVGVATARAAVAALGDGGVPTPTGALGRLAVRGPVVMAGYDGPGAVDVEALAAGWFATGEEGVTRVGPDGRTYAFVTTERVIPGGSPR